MKFPFSTYRSKVDSSVRLKTGSGDENEAEIGDTVWLLSI
jgi:hypothetical protein